MPGWSSTAPRADPAGQPMGGVPVTDAAAGYASRCIDRMRRWNLVAMFRVTSRASGPVMPFPEKAGGSSPPIGGSSLLNAAGGGYQQLETIGASVHCGLRC